MIIVNACFMIMVHASPMIFVLACTMIIVYASLIIIVHECTKIILHACTMIIVHVPCPTRLMFGAIQVWRIWEVEPSGKAGGVGWPLGPQIIVHICYIVKHF